MDPDVELVVGDVRDPAVVRGALEGVDAVFHFAARVGVGQSMYEIADYTDVNNIGTAVLAEAVLRHPVERLVLASSMSVYGEGLYRSADGRVVETAGRSIDQLRTGLWDPRNWNGQVLIPLPTPEWKRASLASVYALSKYQQERLCMILSHAYDVPVVALRFFNVYGSRQALSNPYTGVLAIFAARLLNGRRPILYEDGGQPRDFVNVRDVVSACVLALDEPHAPAHILNIASGQPRSVEEIAMRLAAAVGRPELTPIRFGQMRSGRYPALFRGHYACARGVGLRAERPARCGPQRTRGLALRSGGRRSNRAGQRGARRLHHRFPSGRDVTGSTTRVPRVSRATRAGAASMRSANVSIHSMSGSAWRRSPTMPSPSTTWRMQLPWPLPAALDDVPFPGGPLGCAMNVFRRAAIEPGHAVAIVGIGFLGALLTRLAAETDATVIAISRRPFSLAVARRMGATEALPLDDSARVLGAVRALTAGRGCDCVIEAVGIQRTLDLASRLTRERGRLVIAGFHQDGPRWVDLQLWNWRGLDVINAHEREPSAYMHGIRDAIEAVACGRIDPTSLCTHRFGLDELGAALDAVRQRPDGFLKALVVL